MLGRAATPFSKFNQSRRDFYPILSMAASSLLEKADILIRIREPSSFCGPKPRCEILCLLMWGFRVGDRVQLKSGGPIMTVRKIYYWNGDIECNWFEYGTLREGTFRPEQLKREQLQPQKPS